MNTLKLIIILICYGCFALGNDEQPYCFQFTWPGPMSYNNTQKLNCTRGLYFGVPCVKPLIAKMFYPNTTEIYLEHKDKPKDNDNSFMCSLGQGWACIKYTNTYNNAIIFASHYCGRVIEDKTTAISSGCFNYAIDGHVIEVCACQSQPGEPCNIATKQIVSILMLLPSMIILFYYIFS
ncbi:uncharacterized protein LOC122525185 [Polistes fuscatus]|uniref:uncharacterized protein LOC122525185 n=1 Tax=Polistes fuscatus TaxID=30207 RepID=UPI001CAA35A4|nr:uncharacterized protein LOC122525185 [Polistes fuscatus]